MRSAEQTVSTVMIGAAVVMTILSLPIGHGVRMEEIQLHTILASGPMVLLVWMMSEKLSSLSLIIPLALLVGAIFVPTHLLLSYLTELGVRIAMLGSLGLCLLTRPSN